MKTEQTTKDIRLEMACSQWLTLSMIIFGVVDAQMVRGRRILGIREMMTLHEVGGKLKKALLYAPTFAWHHEAVLLSGADVDVILKAISWYEDSLVRNMGVLEKILGEKGITDRYETLTKITRAIQTAPKVSSDQLDR